MWRRLKRHPRDREEATAEYRGTDEALLAEIVRLAESSPPGSDPESDRRLLRLRHVAGIRLLAANGGSPRHPEPANDLLPANGSLPEIAADDVTPELIRAGILRDGCLLVRGLVGHDDAVNLAEMIDRSFAERERVRDGKQAAPGYYEEFEGEPPYVIGARDWIRAGGGVLAVDAPRLAGETLEMLRSAGVQQLVEGYLGEPPLISLEKTTLRKAAPTVSGAWHQDGAFMGEVRALNLWLSLSRCGDEAPGLDLVPRRLDHIVTAGTDEAVLDYQVSQSEAERAAGDVGTIRPIFEPGDALFFDELFLHSTGSDPSMPKPRYAVECWFFGGSAFPGDYGPVAA